MTIPLNILNIILKTTMTRVLRMGQTDLSPRISHTSASLSVRHSFTLAPPNVSLYPIVCASTSAWILKTTQIVTSLWRHKAICLIQWIVLCIVRLPVVRHGQSMWGYPEDRPTLPDLEHQDVPLITYPRLINSWISPSTNSIINHFVLLKNF